jgi:hypothetical protein
MLTQMRIEIAANIRVELYLISNGMLKLVPVYGFTRVFDYSKDGVSAVFDETGFSLAEKGDLEPQAYQYDVPYPYKRMPVLKAWLMQQNLFMPQPLESTDDEEE